MIYILPACCVNLAINRYDYLSIKPIWEGVAGVIMRYITLDGRFIAICGVCFIF